MSRQTHGDVCREELEQLKPWIQRVVESEELGMDQKLAIHLGEWHLLARWGPSG